MEDIFCLKQKFSSTVEQISCAQRQWLEMKKEDESCQKQQNEDKNQEEQSKNYEIKIMQYNILAPCYTYSDLFPHCTKKDLEWSRRLDLIVKYVLFLAISSKDTLFDLTDALKNHFNISVVHRIKGKSKKDGCTTIFNLDEFEEVYSARLDLDLSNNKQEQLRWINCENICLFTLLRRKDNPESYILVGNTHLIYSPFMGIVKLGQAKLIISAVKSILDAESNKKIDVFLCGDFNFIPNSAVYSFMSEQKINFSTLQLLEVSNQKFAYMFEKNNKQINDHFQSTTRKFESHHTNPTSTETLPQYESLMGLNVSFDLQNNSFIIEWKPQEKNNKDHTIQSPFNIKSAYAEFYKQYHEQNPNSKDSLINNLLQDVKNKDNMTFEYSVSHMTKQGYLQCDFIWYNFAEPIKNKGIKNILQLHDYTYLNSFKAFPNQNHPSDHLPMVATFII